MTETAIRGWSGLGRGLTVTREALATSRRSLALWSVAVIVVTAIYTSFYPSLGAEGTDLTSYVDNLPDGLVSAFGFDTISSPGGYLGSTVYGLLGPALLLVFAITTGGRLSSPARRRMAPSNSN